MLDALRATHGLSPTFLLRALCKGDLAFFESSLATIARLPQENVAQLIRDRGTRGFQSLYARAGLPQQLFAAFRTALDVVIEVRAQRPDGQLPKKLIIPNNLVANILTTESEGLGIAVVRIPENELSVFLDEARDGFQEHVSGSRIQ